jgi:putative transposase
MSRYRRAKIEGGIFFFTLALADRSSDLLVRQIDRLRHSYMVMQESLPPPAGASSNPASPRGLPAAQTRAASKVAKREKGIWQRRYWEHAIRDDTDFERHVDYIHYYPVKHRLVTRAADWLRSSFLDTWRRASCRKIGAAI